MTNWSDELQMSLTKDLSKSLHLPAASALMNKLCSKLVESEHPDASTRAITKFTLSNDKCSKWCDVLPELIFLDEMRGEFKRECERFFTPIFDDWSHNRTFQRGYAGPGASIGCGGRTDFISKFFDRPLSSSHPWLLERFKSAVSNFPEWTYAERQRFLRCGDLTVEGSRLSTVAKNVNVRRCICTEPSVDMWYQLGLGDMISSRLKESFGIDLRYEQYHNRRLASIGSRTGRFSTIDLESASDSISLRMLEALLPKCFVGLLKLYRSPKTQILGNWVDMHMVSSMGNGFTFPLMTAILAIALRCSYSFRGFREKDAAVGRNFGVFGDDIVIEADAFNFYISFVKYLGFSVNEQKSYNEGLFRESCGGDYYNGDMIRPIYIKSLRTPQDRYNAINRLIYWSSVHRIPLYHTVDALLRGLPKRRVPLWSPVTSGIRVGISLMPSRGRYSAWEVSPKRVVPSVSNEACYIGFIAGTLRDGVVTLRDPQGIPPRYTLRRRSAPHTWGGTPSDVGVLDTATYHRWITCVEDHLWKVFF